LSAAFYRGDLNQDFIRAAMIDDHLPNAAHVSFSAREPAGDPSDCVTITAADGRIGHADASTP
jgi:hypothetical protein